MQAGNPAFEIGDEAVWWGPGQPFGQGSGGIGTTVAPDVAGVGSSTGQSIVSSSGIVSAESIAPLLTNAGLESIPAVAPESAAAVGEWLDGVTSLGTQAEAAGSPPVMTLEQLGLVTQRVEAGVPVEIIAAELGFPGMTATDLEAVGAMLGSAAEVAGEGATVADVVGQVMPAADALGLTGGAEAVFGGADLTLKDLVGLDILTSSGIPEASALDGAGMAWLPPEALAEANQAANEIVGPWVRSIGGSSEVSIPEVLQTVNTAIGRGVPTEQALADAHIAMSPAEYEGLIGQINTRLAQIAHPW